MTDDARNRNEPKSTLQQMDIHDSWSRQFRSGENDAFCTLAFDYIAAEFGDPGGAEVLGSQGRIPFSQSNLTSPVLHSGIVQRCV